MQRPNFENSGSSREEPELSGGNSKVLRYASLAAKNDIDSSASSPKSKKIDQIMKVDSGIIANRDSNNSNTTRESGAATRDTLPLNYFQPNKDSLRK